MFEMNLIDAALIVILCFFSLKGLFRGLVREVAGLLGFAAGFMIARSFSARLAPMLVHWGISDGFSSVAAFTLLFLGGIFTVGFAAQGLHRLLESAFAGGIDRFFGLVAGMAKGILVAGIIGYIAIRLFPDAGAVRHSQVLPPLMDLVQGLAGSLDLHIPKI